MKKIIPTFLLAISASSNLLLGNITANYNNQAAGNRLQGTGCRKSGSPSGEISQQVELTTNYELPTTNRKNSGVNLSSYLMMNPAELKNIEEGIENLKGAFGTPERTVTSSQSTSSHFIPKTWYIEQIKTAEQAEQEAQEKFAVASQQLEEAKVTLASLEDQISKKESLKPALKAAREKVQADLTKLRVDKESALQKAQEHQIAFEITQQVAAETAKATQERRDAMTQAEKQAKEQEEAGLETMKAVHLPVMEELKSVIAYDQQECDREVRLAQAVQGVDEARNERKEIEAAAIQAKINAFQVQIKLVEKQVKEDVVGRSCFDEYNSVNQNWIKAIEEQIKENAGDISSYEEANAKICHFYTKSVSLYKTREAIEKDGSDHSWGSDCTAPRWRTLSYTTSNAEPYFKLALSLQEAAIEEVKGNLELADLYTKLAGLNEIIAIINDKAAAVIVSGYRKYNSYEHTDDSWKSNKTYWNEMLDLIKISNSQLVQAADSLAEAAKAKMEGNSELVDFHIQKANQNYDIAAEYLQTAQSTQPGVDSEKILTALKAKLKPKADQLARAATFLKSALEEHNAGKALATAEQKSDNPEESRIQREMDKCYNALAFNYKKIAQAILVGDQELEGACIVQLDLNKESMNQLRAVLLCLKEIPEANNKGREEIASYYKQRIELRMALHTEYQNLAQSVNLKNGEEKKCREEVRRLLQESNSQLLNATQFIDLYSKDSEGNSLHLEMARRCQALALGHLKAAQSYAAGNKQEGEQLEIAVMQDKIAELRSLSSQAIAEVDACNDKRAKESHLWRSDRLNESVEYLDCAIKEISSGNQENATLWREAAVENQKCLDERGDYLDGYGERSAGFHFGKARHAKYLALANEAKASGKKELAQKWHEIDKQNEKAMQSFKAISDYGNSYHRNRASFADIYAAEQRGKAIEEEERGKFAIAKLWREVAELNERSIEHFKSGSWPKGYDDKYDQCGIEHYIAEILKDAADKLKKAIEGDQNGQPEIAKKYRDAAILQQQPVKFFMAASKAYQKKNDSDDRATAWWKDREATNWQEAGKYSNLIVEKQEKYSKGDQNKDPEIEALLKNLAEQDQRVIDYHCQSAEAYAQKNPEKGKNFDNAASHTKKSSGFLSQSIDALKQAMMLEKAEKKELALGWRKSASQYQLLADYERRFAEVYLRDNKEEITKFKRASELFEFYAKYDLENAGKSFCSAMDAENKGELELAATYINSASQHQYVVNHAIQQANALIGGDEKTNFQPAYDAQMSAKLLKNASSALEQAMSLEKSAKPELALGYRRSVIQWQLLADYYKYVAETYNQWKEEDSKHLEKANYYAGMKDFHENQGAAQELKEADRALWNAMNEESKGKLELAAIWQKTASQRHLAGDYYRQLAWAYIQKKEEDIKCLENAASNASSSYSSLNTAAQTLEKAIWAESAEKLELAAIWKNSVLQCQVAADYYAQAATLCAQGKQQESKYLIEAARAAAALNPWGLNSGAAYYFSKAAEALEQVIQLQSQGKSELAGMYHDLVTKNQFVAEQYCQATEAWIRGDEPEGNRLKWNVCQKLESELKQLEKDIENKKKG